MKKSFATVCAALTLGLVIARGDVIISEFVAGTGDGLRDENGEVHDWIEIQNRGTDAVNLFGWSLTDNHSNPGKWTFPSQMLSPGQFLVVFASGKDRRVLTTSNRFHTNFKLNASGEYLALLNAESPRAAVTEFAPKFPEQRSRYSYGLDSTNRWRYFQTPTPGASNGVSAIVGIASPPRLNVERGLFDKPFSLSLTGALAATIRYTTDGSEPTTNTGSVYDSALRITT